MGKRGVGLIKGEILTRGERSQHLASLTSQKTPNSARPDPRRKSSGIRGADPDSQPNMTFSCSHSRLLVITRSLCIISREVVQPREGTSVLVLLVGTICEAVTNKMEVEGSTPFLSSINYNIQFSVHNCVFNQVCNERLNTNTKTTEGSDSLLILPRNKTESSLFSFIAVWAFFLIYPQSTSIKFQLKVFSLSIIFYQLFYLFS